jgi:crotonobetaine/carnitine-CoA ligase
LEGRAETDPDHPFCIWDGGRLTVGQLNSAANRLANSLLGHGLKPGDTVALMLDHHVDHIVAVFALAKAGLVRTSINVNARGDYLSLLLADARPRAVVAETGFRDVLASAMAQLTTVEFLVWRGGRSANLDFGALLDNGADRSPAVKVAPDDPLVLNYTSGTTGAPKKFSRSDRVLQIGSLGCLLIGDLGPGDVLLFWEPLYHGAGSQTALAAIMERVTLALTPRFSASRFWSDAKKFGATRIHYIGGIPSILLKQPPGPADRDHDVQIAWGAGCPADVWRQFEDRFGVLVHEGYGLSEVANFVCINRDGPRGSIGRVLPYFDVRIVDDDERDVPAGATGQIVVRGKQPENTSRSLNAAAATTKDGWIKTGDLARQDENEYLYFEGRRSDSLRRRGENVSAWEVERIIARHPAVAECALVGVPSGVGDDDLKAFVRVVPSAQLTEVELIKWCDERMPYFQVPRYVAFVEELPKTPSERIRKGELSRSVTDCWDLEASGYSLKGKRPSARPDAIA